jgi:SAM-dependent methyltransferase
MKIAEEAGKTVLATAKRMRAEVDSNTVKAGFAVLVWDERDGKRGRLCVRLKFLPFRDQICDLFAICNLMHHYVHPYSAIESNNRHLKDGKHVLGSVLEELLAGAPISESSAVEKMMAASRQFMAHAQAIASMSSSNPAGQVYYHLATNIK